MISALADIVSLYYLLYYIMGLHPASAARGDIMAAAALIPSRAAAIVTTPCLWRVALSLPPSYNIWTCGAHAFKTPPTACWAGGLLAGVRAARFCCAVNLAGLAFAPPAAMKPWPYHNYFSVSLCLYHTCAACCLYYRRDSDMNVCKHVLPFLGFLVHDILHTPSQFVLKTDQADMNDMRPSLTDKPAFACLPPGCLLLKRSSPFSFGGQDRQQQCVSRVDGKTDKTAALLNHGGFLGATAYLTLVFAAYIRQETTGTFGTHFCYLPCLTDIRAQRNTPAPPTHPAPYATGMAGTGLGDMEGRHDSLGVRVIPTPDALLDWWIGDGFPTL